MARPLLKWAGGKTLLVPEIFKLFTQNCERYVEPFVGGGAVFLALGRDAKVLINDSNPDLINFYLVIRSMPAQLMRILDSMQGSYSESYYYRLRDFVPTSPVEKAARLLFLNKTCFNGLYRENSKGQFNVSYGKRKVCPELYDEKNLIEVSDRLKQAEICCEDFSVVLRRTGNGDMVYCDPPYLPVSSTACFSSYTKERFDLRSHRTLEQEARSAAIAGATVLISNSVSAMEQRLYAGWQITHLDARRAINCKGHQRGAVKEIVACLSPETAKHLLLESQAREIEIAA